MAVSRRLFLGGLFTTLAAPAIVTSSGFKPAVLPQARGLCRSYAFIDEFSWLEFSVEGTSTGRISSTKPEWQEFPSNTPKSDTRLVRKHPGFAALYAGRGQSDQRLLEEVYKSMRIERQGDFKFEFMADSTALDNLRNLNSRSLR